MSKRKANGRVVIFPFMAQGHTLPLLDLAKAFTIHHNLKVTIITTPSNAKTISDYISPLHFPTISLSIIPFPPIHGLPKGTENTSQLPSMQEFYVPFLHATKKLKQPFEQILNIQQSRPLCVISDFFLGWTLDSCRAFGIPRLVFHGMSVCSMAISKSLWCAPPQLKAMMTSSDENQPLDLPNMKLPFTLTAADVPAEVMTPKADEEDLLAKYIDEVGWADANSWGIVVNSFLELELSHIEPLEKFYFNGAKAWCLGPLLLSDRVDHEIISQNENSFSGSKLSRWLDEQVAPASIIYVSFGTQADISSSQLDEVAYGLEESGFRFVWVIRSKSWAIPDGLEEKIKRKGFIAREWVDQRRILEHRSVGGFLSHCGWNSILESISAGVPILAWPMIAEQPLNAKLIADGLGAGLQMEKLEVVAGEGVVFNREAICKGVRELMGSEKGRRARERAQALGRVAHQAVQRGGSSNEALSRLISELRRS
ncbi:Scopoletin glucosyltransferase [Linum grandiflorum]